MMNHLSIRRLLAVGLLTISLLTGFASVAPGSAEAHDTPPWQCQYLADAQPNGERYSWMVNNCIPWRTTHTYYETYGWTWPCHIKPVGTAERNECFIRKVFGYEGGVALANAAVSVSMCESTLRLHAQNGQYLGLFQMGSSERARFGHGSSAIEQAQGALRYWRIAGWGPWECKP